MGLPLMPLLMVFVGCKKFKLKIFGGAVRSGKGSVDSEVLALGFASDEMMYKPAEEVGSYY